MFRDRNEAAERLAKRLQGFRGGRPLVLAIPRGGVPMGRVIADALEGELDVVLVHKLGAPGNAEFAIGSVDENGTVQLTDAAERYGISDDYIRRETETQLDRIKQRREHYGRPPANPHGRITIVVDDGVATGSTLLAALQSIRAQAPKRLIAAIGVAPPDAARRIEGAVDEFVCLETPASFYAVGQFFEDFGQVSDRDVITLLGGTTDE